MSVADIICIAVAAFITMLLVTPFKHNREEDEND
jgi:hypothetical protein